MIWTLYGYPSQMNENAKLINNKQTRDDELIW